VTDESGEVAFTVEIDGYEPTPHSTLQDAMCRVEGYENPTGASFTRCLGRTHPSSSTAMATST
jgi:hypothetical protein